MKSVKNGSGLTEVSYIYKKEETMLFFQIVDNPSFRVRNEGLLYVLITNMLRQRGFPDESQDQFASFLRFRAMKVSIA